MNLQIFYVWAIAGIATVLLYLVIDRMLPGRVQAANDRELSLQDKAIDKIQEVYDTRRTRVDLVNAGVPNFLWYSLIGGAVLVALFPLLTKPHLTVRILIAVAIRA